MEDHICDWHHCIAYCNSFHILTDGSGSSWVFKFVFEYTDFNLLNQFNSCFGWYRLFLEGKAGIWNPTHREPHTHSSAHTGNPTHTWKCTGNPTQSSAYTGNPTHFQMGTQHTLEETPHTGNPKHTQAHTQQTPHTHSELHTHSSAHTGIRQNLLKAMFSSGLCEAYTKS